MVNLYLRVIFIFVAQEPKPFLIYLKIIIDGRKTIRSVISNCIPWKRIKAENVESCPVTLPKNIIKDGEVFEVTRVNMTGPLFLRNKTKIWICLFTYCAVYQRVYLELITSLSTGSFLQALRRFISRSGRPSSLC